MHLFNPVVSSFITSYIGLARTVYIHRIWPYIWWFPCQKYRIHTVYIWLWPALFIHTGMTCLSQTYVLLCHLCWMPQTNKLLRNVRARFPCSWATYVKCHKQTNSYKTSEPDFRAAVPPMLIATNNSLTWFLTWDDFTAYAVFFPSFSSLQHHGLSLHTLTHSQAGMRHTAYSYTTPYRI
jgi:hypothetical protein